MMDNSCILVVVKPSDYNLLLIVYRQILFTRGKSSISIGSLLSLRKISPELDTSKANEYNNVPPKSQILSVKDLCEWKFKERNSW